MDSRLILFDIDGTLITSGGAGERALRLGFRDQFGIDDDLQKVEIAGRTDSGIARQMLHAHGLEENQENLSRFFEGYLNRLREQLPQSHGRLLPGILELLEALRPRPDVVLALLTGNLERGAELKLTHYGIWSYFEFGAYADDHHDRDRLGPVVHQRALARHGIDFASNRIFVLGDTPHDIACARVIGARAIGVATGKYTMAELTACGADVAFEDLGNVPAVLEALGLR